MSINNLKSLSVRARGTTISPMRILAPSARRAKERGVRIHHLNLGQPTMDSPESFFEGLKVLDLKNVGYEETQGYRLLREAWSGFYGRSLQIDIPPENMIITNGASEAVLFALSACCDAGDEIIVFDPSYANYLGLAVMAGVRLVPIGRTIENSFAMPPVSRIASHISPRTKAILLCNPDNPTGRVYGRQEMDDLLDLCHQRDLFMIVDEVYREFVYDGLKPCSIFNISPRNKRVILIDSLSKRFSLCGSRLGCLAAFNDEILIAALVFASLRLSAPVVDQYAATYMFEHLDAGYIDRAVEAFARQRDALCDVLLEEKDILCPKPQGAFYSTIRLPVADSLAFAAFLLNEFESHGQSVFVTPAGGFYFQGDGGFDELRLAFVLSEEELQNAAVVLVEGLRAFRNRS